MDLTIQSNKVYFSASCGFSDIIVYFCRQLNLPPDLGSKFKLTKKEVKDLANYLRENSSENGCSSWIIDQLFEMEMFMKQKEKAEFYFW